MPPGLDWDMFLGPAQMKPYSKNKFAYNWHWFWDTGNGDIGNQGVHEMDIALWGLGKTGWPVSVTSTGGKFGWKDDQETPNTQIATFDFGDAQMTFDVRNLPTPPEGGGPIRGPNYVGNIFFGTGGFLVVDHSGFEVYKSTAGDISGEAARGAGAGSKEKYEKVMEEKSNDEPTEATCRTSSPRFDHAITRSCTRISRSAARAASFCHLANIAYRVGHTLRIDQATGKFVGDGKANELWTRKYRSPYVIPENV